MKSSFMTKLFLLGTIGILPAGAASFSWGNAIFSSTSYNSDGSELEEGSDTDAVTFELGIFQNGGSEFTPSISNVGEWAGNFISFGSFSYDPASGGGYVTGGASFGTAAGQIDNTTAPAGYRVYLWGYQEKNLPTGGELTDWLLITGDAAGDNEWSNSEWAVPDASTTNQSDLQRQWTVKTADTAIVGSVMGSDGRGEISSPQALNMNDVQFAAVPESGSVLLLLVGILGGLTHRRRS